MTLPVDRFPFAQEIRDELIALQAAHPTLCTVHDVNEDTVNFPDPIVGDPAHVRTFRSNFLRIGRASQGGTARHTVLFTGGVHAREWAPPTALVLFADRLLTAIAGGTGFTVGSYTKINADAVRAINEKLDVIIAPLINPDGYEFSQRHDSSSGSISDRGNRGWRKNRRPAPSLPPTDFPTCTDADLAVGVDINRNFAVLWDFQTAYISDNTGFRAGTTTLIVQSSKSPCASTFIGPGPYPSDTPTPPTPNNGFTEAESRNLKHLLETREPRFFVDCHMFGETVLHSWGVEQNQGVPGATPVLASTNLRDGTRLTALTGPDVALYFEPINDVFLAEVAGHAAAMATAAGSTGTGRTYSPSPGALPVSISGASDDFAFSRNLGTNRAVCRAFTLECGQSHLPDFLSEFPAVKDEVHAGLLELLFRATTAPTGSSGSTTGGTGTTTGTTGTTPTCRC